MKGRVAGNGSSRPLPNAVLLLVSFLIAGCNPWGQPEPSAPGFSPGISNTMSGGNGILPVSQGGTGATAAAGARVNLGLGTASVLDAGIAAGNVMQLDSSARLPAIDGSQLTHLIYPVTATLWHDQSKILTGNPFWVIHESNQNYSVGAQQNTPADGDSFSDTFPLKGGSYTLNVLGITYSDKGMIDWYIDGVLFLSGQDWYTPGVTYNVVKSTPITIVGDGLHTLTGLVNGRNAASTNYFMEFTKVWIQ